MTGQPPPRGGRTGNRDPWRGARPTLPEHQERRDVELEELPAQAVARSAWSPIGRSTAIGVVALVATLAAGLGVLGGKPQASAVPADGLVGATPGVTGAAAASIARPSDLSRTPGVTPEQACAPDPTAPPEISLVADDVPIPGTVVVDGPEPTPQRSGPANPAEVASLRADGTTEVRIVSGECAVAWRIFLLAADGSDATQIAFQANSGRDPAYARQNRFELPLANAGIPQGPLELQARLTFPGLDVVATWQVVIVPFDRPEPLLRVRGTGTSVPTVEGCNVVMMLRNGQRDGPACPDDLSAPLPASTSLRPGTALVFVVEGWSVTEAVMVCGRLSGLQFVAVPQPGCWQEPQETVVFVAPEPGDWAVAASACAVGFTRFAANRICGTWYAAIDTR